MNKDRYYITIRDLDRILDCNIEVIIIHRYEEEHLYKGKLLNLVGSLWNKEVKEIFPYDFGRLWVYV